MGANGTCLVCGADFYFRGGKHRHRLADGATGETLGYLIVDAAGALALAPARPQLDPRYQRGSRYGGLPQPAKDDLERVEPGHAATPAVICDAVRAGLSAPTRSNVLMKSSAASFRS